MRIGIDAKWYFNGNVSGREVIVNLIKAIAENPGPHKYVIILDAKDKNKYFPYTNHSNFEMVYLRTVTNQVTNFFSAISLSRYQMDICVYQYFAPLFSPFKRVIYIHDVIFETSPQYFSWKERFYFRQIKAMAKRAHGIITVSETEKKRLKHYGYGGVNTQILALHNGLSEKFHQLPIMDESVRQHVKEKYKLPEKYILYLGRINKRKNIPALIKAFAKAEIDGLTLVIAGATDWSKIDVGQIIAENKVAEKVIVAGFIEDEHIPIVYQLASAFCFLSFDEGFGLPIVEAMSCGVPVIVSDTSISHEICGEAALYVAPDDIDAISLALRKVVSNDESTQNRINLGKQITQNYRWEKTANKLVTFLSEL